MATVSLTIDGKKIEVPEGTYILEAALDNGIYIPHLCYLERLRPHAGCRLCLVETESARGNRVITACTQPVWEGLVVHTNTPQVKKQRQAVLEIILSDHPSRCLTCPRPDHCALFTSCLRDPVITDRCAICAKNGRCELQEVVEFVGVPRMRFEDVPRQEFPLDRSNPFIERDWNKCISCGRCVRACLEYRGVGAMEFAYRGGRMMIDTPFGTDLKHTNCTFCGQCVTVCPTGALMDRMDKYAGPRDRSVPSVCTYCGVGCNIRIDLKGARVVGISPREQSNPVNRDFLCVKGKYAYDFIQSSDRLTTPLVKDMAGSAQEATWDEALDLVASRLAEIRAQYGPAAIGVIASSKGTNEEAFLAQKFARGVIGTNNVDQCVQFSHRPTLDSLTRAFGSAAMTTSGEQIERAGCILVVGSNTTETHPVLALRILWAVRLGAKLIVVNPREIDLCRFAHFWLRLNPGTDVALINGMLRAIVDEDLWNAEFVGARCDGFDALTEALQEFPVEQAAEITGVPADDIVMAARLVATGGHDPRYEMPPVYFTQMVEVGTHGDTDGTCILYGSELTQHYYAHESVQALANLALITGNLGREGAGLCPLADQNNSQGTCDMGALPHVLPGYQSFEDSDVRAKFEDAWGVTLPDEPGLNMMEMLEAAHSGKLKALYVIGGDPLLTAPDLKYVRECLESLDLLVVQDIFYTDTAQLAHVVLPSACFAEKDGTFTNTERRVQRINAAIPAPGESLADWQILSRLAQHPRLYREPRNRPDLLPRQDFSSWKYVHPASILGEINALVPQYGGVTYDRLETRGIQWPCPSLNHPGTEILYTEGFDRERGQIIPVDYAPPREPVDEAYPLPLVLVTGSTLFHHHTGRLTTRCTGLMKICPEALLEIHPDDAAKLDVEDGDVVRVTSRRGSVLVHARITERSPVGLVFLPIHFAETAVNLLTARSPQPASRMPDLQYSAVRVEKVEVGDLDLAELRELAIVGRA